MLKLKFTKQETALQYSKETMQEATGKDWEAWSSIVSSTMNPKQDFSSFIDSLVADHQLSPAWARTIASYYIIENP